MSAYVSECNNRLRDTASGLSATKHDASLAAGFGTFTRSSGGCPHEVLLCYTCIVTPLISPEGRHLSYLLEHRAKNGKCIKCTVGTRNLPQPKGLLKPGLVPGSILPRPTVDGNAEMSIDEYTKIVSASDVLRSLSQPETGTPETSSEASPVAEVNLADFQELHNTPEIDDDTELDVLHTKSTIGSQLAEVKEKMSSSFPPSLIRKCSKALSQLVLLSVGLCHDTNLESVVTRCIAFLDAMLDDGIVMNLHDILFSYVKDVELPAVLKGKTVQECYALENEVSAPETLSPTAMAVWDTLKKGVFTKHLSYVVGTAFAFFTCKIQNIEFSHPLHDSIMKHAESDKIDGVDFIDHVLKLYNWISTVGAACLEQRSLKPLTLNSGGLAKCHEGYYAVKQWFIDAKRDGTSTMEERQLQYVKIETIYKTLVTLCKIERDKFTTLQASSLIREVGALYNEIKDFVLKIDAVKVARGIHLHGPPKTGKSYISAAIHEQHCLARDVVYRETDNAQLNLMAEFQDEIHNSTQSITVNETSAIKEQYAKSIETAYTTSLALVDPVPYHPNRSNIEDKAKITAQHISVVSTGNTEEPFIHVAKTPGAWTRRYTSVYMRVAPKFADAHGRFDSSKSDGSHNYHIFDVYEIVYSESGHKKRVYYKFKDGESRDMNTCDFMELVRALAIAHYASEDRLEGERKKEKKAGCTKCKRLAHFCTCVSHDVRISTDEMTQVQATVVSGVSEEDMCPGCTRLGPHGNKCEFQEGCEYCIRCGNIPSEPESGKAVNAVLSFGSSLFFESIASWMNPFIRLRWIWSIDSLTTESLREDLLEEISYIPDTIGTTAFSLVPQSWLERPDGQPNFLGKQKDRFLRFVAAEKQMFLPLRVFLKRAFTISLITFIVCTCIVFGLDYFGFERHHWEFTQRHTYEVTRWGWIPMYPEYSDYVMENRDHYAQKGIYTLAHLEWQEYYINLYFFQRLLGKIFYFWHYQETVTTYILVRKMADWWHFPLIMSLSYFVLSFLWMWFRRALGFHQRYENLKIRAASDKDLQKNLYDKIRRCPQEYNTLVPTAIGLMGVIISGLTLWNMIRSNPEGGIVRDGKGDGNAWNSFMLFNRSTPTGSVDNGVTTDDTVNRMKRAICLVKATVGGEETEVVGTFVQTGFLMLPRHFFKPDPMKDELQDVTDLHIDCNGFTTKVRIYKESLKPMDGKDCVIIKVPKGPKMKHDVIELLPTQTGSDCHSATLVHLREGPEKTNAKYVARVDCGGYSCGRGVTYRSNCTQVGYCGTPVVRKGVVMGFHISGDRTLLGQKIGNAQEIMRSDVEGYIESLRNDPDYISTPEAGVVPEERLGYRLIKGEGPHPKTKVFEELAEYHGIKVLGNNPDLVRYRSRVRKSMISDGLAQVTGRRNKWKSPDMRAPWIHHNKALKFVAEGAWEVPPLALKWAFDDYLSDILKRLPAYKEAHPDLCRVLDDFEMVNGIPESMYMKIVNMKSSIGPIGKASGSKIMSDLFVEIERGSNNEKRYKLAPHAQKYHDEMKDYFRRGIKYGVWTRTCLKDEVVDEDSEKVRIFYILECIFALLVRKYYLPIAEFISRNPLLCECAVGINCAGPEWELTMQYVQELATDEKMVDWDYSKYDLKRSQDVTIASMNVMRRIAEFMGYSEEELKIMDGIADELRNPTIDWNGTIISCFLWSSGNSMTVYGNSIENSFYNRIFFYVNGVSKLGLDAFLSLGSFRENERIITYGDDGQSGSKPSVRSLCNFSAKESYFSSINMKITDAAKSDDPADEVHRDLIDFLKRKSVHHEKLNCRVGALSLTSIDKMGHMVSGSGDLEDLAVNAIITMLLESFLHGPEIYGQYREELSQVAKDHDLWTEYLDFDYDTLVDRWHEKY
jgi:hypothetical protein